MNLYYKIPFYSLSRLTEIRQDLIHAFIRAYDESTFILGPDVTKFENVFASYSGVTHSIAVSNGLDALKISLKSLGLTRDTEVIVPTHTYIATIFAIMQAGLKPILVDIDENIFNIDIKKISTHIGFNTKVILPVHLYGQPCKMDEILKIAQKNNLYVVEDNAQAQGAEYKSKKTGGWGNIGATSFYPSKNLGALGDAGGIMTNDDDLAHRCRLLCNVGSDKKYIHEIEGYNARMDSIQASFLLEKLKYLDKWILERVMIAHRYFDNLKSCKHIILPSILPGAAHTFHLFVIRCEARDKLKEYLSINGIETLIHYPIPSHLQPALRHLGYQTGDFPSAEKISKTCLSLPIYPGLRLDEIDYVCEKILEFDKSERF